MKENITVITGAVVMAILIAVTIVFSIGVDNEAPEIYFEHDIMYSDIQSMDVLLEGVTAYDRKDGDVTEQLMVESLIVLEGNEFAKVTYTAKDKSNNIAKASRIVAYSGDGSSIYASSAVDGEEEGEENPEATASQEVTASQEATASQETTASQEMASAAESMETEMTSDTQTESTGAETTAATETTGAINSEAPVLTLKTSSGSIKAGEFFNVASYVESITDNKDSRNELYKRIGIEGSYDSNTPGEYRFKVYCIDTDRNFSNKEEFVLSVVGE